MNHIHVARHRDLPRRRGRLQIRVLARDRDGGRSYYAAENLDSLRHILQEIEDALSGCIFDVPLTVTADARVTVLVGGVSVPSDEGRRTNGWVWSGIERSSISLFGEACARRVASEAIVEVIVSCDPSDGG